MATQSLRKQRSARAQSAGDKILQVAAELFYRKGIRAVGVEEIVNAAGVAKISLYRRFASKDELIVAYLEDRNGRFWRDWDATFTRHEEDASAHLLAVMTYLQKRTTASGYRGCPFINFASEYPDPRHPGHRVVEANKMEWRRRLERIAKALKASQPRALADALLLIVEGAYAISQTLGGRKGPGMNVVSAAQTLVRGAGAVI